ncbi:MAG: DNA segregation ATPase FtsK [Rhodobacteraceae bacterium HLUCCA12]|nr:MAG: DNA segregation ATPase FtsK [Rhodobacteraceae bacterium HLUCCA12]
MATYHSPQRQPLLDQRLQQALSQRGKELLGIGLICAGAVLALMLGSYSPQDPSWMATSDGPVHNALGRVGAAIAAPAMIIMGQAGWGVVVALVAWGLRLMTHRGEENILGRSVFVPIAVALSAVWLATLVPGDGWALDFGLGGMFGDTVLGAVLTALPLTSTAGLNMLTLLSFLTMLALWSYVLGTSWHELRSFGRFLINGLILSYMGVLAMLGVGARGMGGMARRAHGRWQNQRHQRAEEPAPKRAAPAPQGSVHEGQAAAPAYQPQAFAPHIPAPHAEPPLSRGGARVLRATPARAGQAAPQQPAPAGPPPAFHHQVQSGAIVADHRPPAPDAADTTSRPGLLARVLGLRNGDNPDAAARSQAGHDAGSDATGDERIRNRISDLIRARQRQVPTLRIDSARPQLGLPPGTGTAPIPASLAATRSALAGAGEPTAPQSAAPRPAPAVSAAPAAPWFEPAEDDVLDDAMATDAQTVRPANVLNRRVVQPAARRMPTPSRRAQAEAEPRLAFDQAQAVYELPPLSLLTDPTNVERYTLSDDALEENARMLESVLDDYGVRGEIVSVRPGPVVTMYELEPAPGLKASRVIGLADDIARSMSALSARVSTVPGRSVIGIELPNARREKVVLREILGARDFGDTQMRLPLALGKDIGGEAVVANLAKMPHLLIAGTTGSGKSVAINTMILSLLYKMTPQECRLIMIDPKMLELSVYDGIPHLLSPVVTDPKKAVVALKWVVGEMEERYRKMSKMGVRNIDGYNGRVREALSKGEMFKRTVQTGFDDETGDPVFETEEFAPELLPFIVVIVDEMADLMMVAGKEIEACIQRLAQMARASGIHLIMATQRPSVDVITGTIKANFPTRISFQVTSKIDSRTILGEQGAEQLLGMGDMLYMAGGARITRIHGPFVSDEEVEEVVNHLKSFGPPAYQSGVLDGPDNDREADIDAVLGLGDSGGEDALYDQAVAIVARDRKCSTSYIQRKLGIGYNKAARLVEQMEAEGVVSGANHVGKREVLVPESH